MPIDLDDLSTLFVVVVPTATFDQVLSRLPPPGRGRDFSYIVVPTGDGRYIIDYWGSIARVAQARGLASGQLQIGQLLQSAAPSEAVDVSTSQRAAATKRDTQPQRRLVVLKDGAVIGILDDPRRGADDPFMPGANSNAEAMVLGPDDVLGAFEPIPQTPTLPDVAPTDDRVVNGWIEGIERTRPLQMGNTYELKFNVDSPDVRSLMQSTAVGAALDFSQQELIDILVVVDSSDFTLYGLDTLPIVVPKAGRSKNTATFTIEPKQLGAGVVNALIYINSQVFQKFTITLQVVPAGTAPARIDRAVDVQATGITLASAAKIPARPRNQIINLTILKQPAGYRFIVQGAGVSRADLNLSEPQIADWIRNARQALYNIVFLRSDNAFVYQGDTTIAPAIHAATLKQLAMVGTSLYNGLFYDSGDTQSKAMGDLLRTLSADHELNVRVVAERFTFPWSLLYDGDDPDNPEPEHFWGFKHIIEYMPEFTQPRPVGFTPQINVGDTVQLGFVCNTSIDAQFKTTVVADQQQFLSALPGVAVKPYATIQDLITLLKDPNAPPVIYCYCHAESNFPGEGGGVDDSAFFMSDGKIMLRELKIKASNRLPPMASAPLLFVNACEGAELSPYLYDGLVPYLVQRGARGVIGTEVKTPVLFAAEFGKLFMQRFLAGDQPLGALLRDMRREYRDEKNNVLGLIYSLYSSGDVVVQRGT